MKEIPTDFQHLRFRKRNIRSQRDITLDGDMYNLFFAIDAGKSIAQTARETGFELPAIRNVLSRLLALNLIEVVGKQGTTTDANFIDILSTHFIKAVGPFGSFLIEDNIPKGSLSNNGLSPGEASELVMRLAAEITDPQKRQEFKKSMITHIMMKNDSR